MRHIHDISIGAIVINLIEKTKGAPYTEEMVLNWIQKNKKAMGCDYIGEDMTLTHNQALRASIGVHQDLDYDEMNQYFKKVGMKNVRGENAQQKKHIKSAGRSL